MAAGLVRALRLAVVPMMCAAGGLWSPAAAAGTTAVAAAAGARAAGLASSLISGSQAILIGGFGTGLDAYSPASYLWTGSTWTPGPSLTR